jgi:CubicO group peptidase (beta-lactamase class C family)
MNMKKLLVSSLFIGGALATTRLLFAKASSPESSLSGTSNDDIDAFIKGQMRRLHIPGGSMAIVEGDRVVHYRGFGQARPDGETPTSKTPFFIGSLTKSITALAVMQLAEAGKVELDAPVQRYLPWFRVADPDISAQITVRHLLNQTSGFSSTAGSIVLADMDGDDGASERQVRALSTFKNPRPVGTKFEYSNINFNILGLIIEVVSEEKYAGYIQRHVFDPLGMEHSYASKEEAKKYGLAMGYRHWFSLPFPSPDLPIPAGSLAAGQLISCAEDMTHYLAAHLNRGCYAGEQILSKAGIEELHRGVAEEITFGVNAGKYGMGWFEIDFGKVKTYSHSGNVPDFSAFMVILPKEKKGLILLFNADPYGLPLVTKEIGDGVTALLCGQEPPPIRLDFIQWVMRLLPIIPILQVVDVISTLRKTNGREAAPGNTPNIGRNWKRELLLPLIPNLSLAALLIYLRSSGLIRFLNLFMPDLGWIVRISGGFAWVWIFLRTGSFLRVIQQSRLFKSLED